MSLPGAKNVGFEMIAFQIRQNGKNATNTGLALLVGRNDISALFHGVPVGEERLKTAGHFAD